MTEINLKNSLIGVAPIKETVVGPIQDRIDIQKYVQPVDFIKLSDNSKGISSSELRQKVEFARNIQRERYKNIEKYKFKC